MERTGRLETGCIGWGDGMSWIPEAESDSWKRLTRFFKICAWLDSSSLAAALSSAVAELVWTTLEI